MLATSGFQGWTNPYPTRLAVCNAQLAVGDPVKYPEFAGNVKTMESRSYWRDASVSPANQEYHYNRNAETYMLVGDALGRGMIDLLSSINTNPDTAPPTPSPMTWATPLAALSSTAITMTATTASDPSGVQYYFANTTVTAGTHDSAWQDSPTFTDTGLAPSTGYTYTVKARDKSAAANPTAASTPAAATTAAAALLRVAAFDVNVNGTTPSPTQAGFAGMSSTVNGSQNGVALATTVVADGSTGYRDRGASNGGTTAPDLVRDLFFANSANQTTSPYPTITHTLTGLAPNTQYKITYWHYNGGAFQRTALFYETSVSGTLLATHLAATANTSDVSFYLTSNATGVIKFVQTSRDPGGYSCIFNGMTIDTVAPAGFAAWQAKNGTSQPLNLDHDNDGVPNGIEYFLGGPNGNTTGFTPLPAATNTAGQLGVTWTKAADYAGTYGSDYWVETCDTLVGPWIVAATSPTPNTPNTVSVTGNTVTYTFPAGTKNFARLKVSGP